ncbi:hypothetical protein Syun_016612 [Stephania yunnanensis]|uniref:Phthiocerol/phthiodiolone dimycocerosyl transferase C-terminal domain-containing protein n=1 Tax=Stephania yunnanensis TaxID=152371 RepID=A0AAP0J709_9MAGN
MAIVFGLEWPNVTPEVVMEQGEQQLQQRSTTIHSLAHSPHGLTHRAVVPTHRRHRALLGPSRTGRHRHYRVRPPPLQPPNPHSLQTALHKIQNSHPILRSTLSIPPTNISIHPTPHLTLHNSPYSLPSLHLIAEHELNQNPWTAAADADADAETPTAFATIYALPGAKWAVALRLHTMVCDRTTAVALLRELCGGEEEFGAKDGVNLGIEKLVPSGRGSKALWARGFDLVGYSLNSFRFCNLPFQDSESGRSSAVVRLRLAPEETLRLLSGCKERGIKLCGAMGAAGMMAAHTSKQLPEHQWEKYAIVTLVDCRASLDPPLHPYNFGFYHSAILNTHDVCGGSAEFWDLANRCYTSFNNAMNSNKHFTDMDDLNLLMCKAIDNPGLTPSSSLRTSFMAVFEDSVINNFSESAVSQEVGLLDFIGCSSVHGVGPSIAVFDTIRDGALDCACVYPTPLHSREQMEELILNMKTILIQESCNS